MRGMDRNTGKWIDDDFSHFLQSIDTIFTTPRGQRIMLRNFGVKMSLFLDASINEETIADIYMQLAEASVWEPRGELKTLSIESVSLDGKVEVKMKFLYRGHAIEIGRVFNRLF